MVAKFIKVCKECGEQVEVDQGCQEHPTAEIINKWLPNWFGVVEYILEDPPNPLGLELQNLVQTEINRHGGYVMRNACIRGSEKAAARVIKILKASGEKKWQGKLPSLRFAIARSPQT